MRRLQTALCLLSRKVRSSSDLWYAIKSSLGFITEQKERERQRWNEAVFLGEVVCHKLLLIIVELGFADEKCLARSEVLTVGVMFWERKFVVCHGGVGFFVELMLERELKCTLRDGRTKLALENKNSTVHCRTSESALNWRRKSFAPCWI